MALGAAQVPSSIRTCVCSIIVIERLYVGLRHANLGLLFNADTRLGRGKCANALAPCYAYFPDSIVTIVIEKP